MTELDVLAVSYTDRTREFVITDQVVLTFGEVADAVRARVGELRRQASVGGPSVLPVTVDAACTVEFVIDVLSRMTLRVPLVFVHPNVDAESRRSRLALLPPTCIERFEHWVNEQAGDELDSSDILAVMFTSGTTGTPEPIELSWRSVEAACAAHTAHIPWIERDRWLLCLPPSHVGGLMVLLRCLAARRAVVLHHATKFEARTFWNTVNTHHVTLVSLVPTMLRRVVAFARDHSSCGSSDLRAVLIGGAPCDRDLQVEAVRCGIPALMTYGMTESCAQVTTQALHELGQPGCGSPLDGVELRIVDREIHVRGATMHSTPGPRWTLDGWWRTGDLGSIDARGALHVVGRCSEMIITGGENVNPLEVEQIVLRHSEVRDAAAFAVPDEEWGEVVAVALVTTESFEVQAFQGWLREHSSGHLRARRYVLVDTVARTESGKLKRGEIRRTCEGRTLPLG